jgi:hypothetical protein
MAFYVSKLNLLRVLTLRIPDQSTGTYETLRVAYVGGVLQELGVV